MTQLGDLDHKTLKRLAASPAGLRYRLGPFQLALYTELDDLLTLIHQFYAVCTVLEAQHFCHYHVRIQRQCSLKGLLRPKAEFVIDGVRPFEPYPLDQAFPLYEWGLNWCVGTTAHQYLMLHSAVVERNGLAMILPAMPGSGKTTLCAGLIARGWRLFSDEFGLLNHETGQLSPMPRAMPLKNQSIDVIRQFAPDHVIGPLYQKTRKGDVAHVAPPQASLIQQQQTAPPRWLVFPQYTQGESTQLIAQAKSVAFTRLSNNAFNYQMCMAEGFKSLSRLIAETECFQLRYSDLDDAIAQLTLMADEAVHEFAD